jgi:hypothetical protein
MIICPLFRMATINSNTPENTITFRSLAAIGGEAAEECIRNYCAWWDRKSSCCSMRHKQVMYKKDK